MRSAERKIHNVRMFIRAKFSPIYSVWGGVGTVMRSRRGFRGGESGCKAITVRNFDAGLTKGLFELVLSNYQRGPLNKTKPTCVGRHGKTITPLQRATRKLLSSLLDCFHKSINPFCRNIFINYGLLNLRQGLVQNK